MIPLEVSLPPWSSLGKQSWATAVIVLVTVMVWYKSVQNYRWNKKYKFPNRIPGVPIFGNTFQLPPINQGLWGNEKRMKYGEMFTCKFGVQTWVFLNSSRVVKDLLEKRSAIYSSRPHLPMASTLMSGSSRVLFMGYNDRWRAIRKVMHSILNAKNAPTFASFQDIESKHLLYDYLHSPDKWSLANQRYSNSVVMSVVFGKRQELDHPETKELLETSADILNAMQPGANIVDVLPFLEKLPTWLQWWRSRGLRDQEKCKRVYQREVAELKARVEAGTARDCYALQFMKNPESQKFGETQFLFSLGSLLEAGSDTSRVAITQVLAAACVDPRWVKTAREQLDSVCGSNAERLPSVSDRAQLPYITAVTKESFRWKPPPQIGVPHMLTEDDEYEGYRFPKGTVFTWNAFGIILNEEEYDEPLRFWPERFLNEDLENVLKGHWGFGAGRRVCPGYHVGESNVFIAIARLLYCFEFEAVEDQPIDVFKTNWADHLGAPFAMKIKPRSPAHAALAEREGKVAAETKY
ncbi:hypothetical protein HYALB_00001149 [Hymenoscyphus albidus]|uniref:Cytochrome P450 n=1 Tax=Hymenoscyphus albidus TaxID=595503 RepID=A0A9N9LFZ2_9HELO|nr:hypothetical protein HYALB_00001149 [Hymenoscyphus albidus]